MSNIKFKTKSNNSERKLLIIIIVFIVAILATGVLFGAGFFNASKITSLFKKDKTVYDSYELTADQGNNAISTRDAYDIALEKAKEWQTDAALSFIDAVLLDSNGNPKTWKLTFVSKNISGKGFVVEVENGVITNSKEIEYSGTGSELPTNIISQQEAIEKVKKMSGYEDTEILGVEAVYGKGTEIWYWGVKTSKGTVSVEAKK